jgi:hypothetical protein
VLPHPFTVEGSVAKAVEKAEDVVSPVMVAVTADVQVLARIAPVGSVTATLEIPAPGVSQLPSLLRYPEQVPDPNTATTLAEVAAAHAEVFQF